MAKSKSFRELKQVTVPLVIMSRMDYEIACRVYDLLLQIDMDDEELSFLLGKRNKYFFELLDPTEKDKLKTAQLDMLPTILNCTFQDIIPNDVLPGEIVKLHNTSKTVYPHKIVYQHQVEYQDGSKSEIKVWIKEIKKGIRKKIHSEVHAQITKLLESSEDCLTVPRTALSLYNLLKKSLTVPFRPSDLQKSLKICSREDSKKAPLITEFTKDGIDYFMSV